ncbi:hypothetical protein OHA84_13360 [Streptomyces sp. NBC_00513]|uniref:hypothetical protein n=1 Tax=unclassified Streptomyces TaxID=2593676 RepID=UPI002256C606|nr:MULTISPECIES: hypothetical protein [unclassified Streptomyces]MCX5075465.1 hypothetical protein [Streptomyces sp. NBC_00424]MCX5152914.1 hypothetical protein [Streptomyces sp. NBC_00291]WUD41425.1 hypothetical protein OHA84_13360 [Streptomyces sp. NBC_00513]
MALPTAGLAFDRPTGYVIPLIRAGMIEGEREVRPRGEAPEIAVLSDCYQQFGHEGLQRLIMDVACTAAEATTMLAEMGPLNQVEILQEFSAQYTVEAAFESPRNGGVVWGYIPAMLRPIFQPETRPSMDEVLFQIKEKYGFATSMDFIVALANYTGAIVRYMAQSTGRAIEDTIQLLERRAKTAWTELDTYDTRGYMNC